MGSFVSTQQSDQSVGQSQSRRRTLTEMRRLSPHNLVSSATNATTDLEANLTNNQSAHDENGNQLNLANNPALLNSISQVGLYHGPFFVLAGRDDLVPFFRLVESRDAQTNAAETFLNNLLGSIIRNEQQSTAPVEISPVQTCQALINVPAESLHLRQLPGTDRFVVDFNVHLLTLSEIKIDMMELNSYGIPFTTLLESGLDLAVSLPEQKSFELAAPTSTLSSPQTLGSPSEVPLVREEEHQTDTFEQHSVVITVSTLSAPQSQQQQKFIIYSSINFDRHDSKWHIKVKQRQFHIGSERYCLDDVYGYVDVQPTDSNESKIATEASQNIYSIPTTSANQEEELEWNNLELKQQPKDQPKRQLSKLSNPSGTEQQDEMENSPDCVICMSEQKSVIALPCRHMCLCRGCADVMRQQPNSKCPICRQILHALLQIVVAGSSDSPAVQIRS